MKYIKTFEEHLYEGFMSELWIIADDAKDIEDFKKNARKSYPQIKKDKEDDEWLESIYNDAKENMSK